jgi:pimeloyl-ACP methyl ester carboxylesterase
MASLTSARAALGALFIVLCTFVQGISAAERTPAALGDSPVSSDYGREKRWADEILPTLVVGEPIYLEQSNGHKFLALYTPAKEPKGAVLIAHGRGWSPDWGLYGVLRVALADAGYTTLAIQMPVLDAGGKLEAYLHLFDEANERLALGTAYLESKGYGRIGIVSHSLGARMSNEFLTGHPPDSIKAWVSISIINGLQNTQWVKVPMLDIFGEKDWNGVLNGAPERERLIRAIPGSAQVEVPAADHFFEGHEDALVKEVRAFLDARLAK